MATGNAMHSAPIADPDTLGLVLRDARMRRGISQRELAKDLGVTQRYIVELEAGKPTKAIERLLEFAREVGITIYIRDSND